MKWWHLRQKWVIKEFEKVIVEAEQDGRRRLTVRATIARGALELAKLAPRGPGKPRNDAKNKARDDAIIQARAWRDEQIAIGLPKKIATNKAIAKAASATGLKESYVRRLMQEPHVRHGAIKSRSVF
jgi:hypothetical protein